ncbi:MAG: hypothetical protein KDE33_29065 [Bacteroidetes bacterium]|nr:hypothetical protein [Bacteroidota bacterium]
MNNQTISEENSVVSDCTLETINNEIEQLSNSHSILDSIFHLNNEQIIQFQTKELSYEERNDVILKFAARLNDISSLSTKCNPTELINLKVGDLAFYCLAKTEKFPFARATRRQNCTEPNISSEIRIPTNFIYYTSFERERLTYNFLKYLQSEDREEFLKEEGYD